MEDSVLKETIKKAKSGNADAFEKLINEHYEIMYKIAFKWCSNKRDAEDITQEACIKLARGISSFQEKSAFTTWLYRLVINVAKDWQRSDNRHKYSDDQLIDIGVQQTAENSTFAKQVIEQLHQLPEKEKASILLVHSEGLTHRQAANIIGCKESTVSWYIHEARKKLDNFLKGDNND